jgi:hypothetical protein
MGLGSSCHDEQIKWVSAVAGENSGMSEVKAGGWSRSEETIAFASTAKPNSLG